VHTPSGVQEKGGGYGTALYTALCLGAWQTWNDRVVISMRKKKDGISSAEDDRSTEASRWWKAAVDRGLAEREESEADDEREEYVKIDVDPDDLDRIVSLDEEDAHITYVNEVNVDITKPGETKVFDYYTFKSAQDNNLVVLGCAIEVPSIPEVEQLSYLWHQELEDPDTLYEVDTDALLALDVRGLHRDFVDLLQLAYLGSGLGEKAADDLLYRWSNDLDPGSESPQGRLFKNASSAAGMGEVLRARARVGWSDLEDLP
jgi:hypothetical protein